MVCLLKLCVPDEGFTVLAPVFGLYKDLAVSHAEAGGITYRRFPVFRHRDLDLSACATCYIFEVVQYKQQTDEYMVEGVE